MARIKLEVREQARQQRLSQAAMQGTTPPLVPSSAHTATSTTPASIDVPTPAAPAAPVALRTGCIDLTLDDDSDEDDEPLGGAIGPLAAEPGVATVDKIADEAAENEASLTTDDEVESDEDEALPRYCAESADKSATHSVESRPDGATRASGESDADEEEEDEDLHIAQLAPNGAFTPTAPSSVTIVTTSDAAQDDETIVLSESTQEMDETVQQNNQESTAQAQPPTEGQRVELVLESLEDGEIFEEGAVIKSPATVKQAIEQELMAAKAGDPAHDVPQPKKKQKKRGRKKSKRKLDAIAAMNTEIDRISRLGGEAGGSAAGPSLGPLLRSPMGPPALPPGPYSVRGSNSPFADDHIVRVNRHGAVEHFRIQSGFVGTPENVKGGFRYLPVGPRFGVDHESGSSVLGPRGLKRPLPRSTRQGFSKAIGIPRGSLDDDVLDLDSLRAAALRTKRQAAAAMQQNSHDSPTGEINSGDPSNDSMAKKQSDDEDGEETPSLDDIRAELLKSLGRKKRRAIDVSDASNPGDSEKGSGTDEQVERANGPDSAPKAARTVLAPENGAQVPESPQFRPLTALSQSIVIRLSADELADHVAKKHRTDSYDDGEVFALPSSMRAESVGTDGTGRKPNATFKPSVTAQPAPKLHHSALMSAIEAMKKEIAERQQQQQQPKLREPTDEDTTITSASVASAVLTAACNSATSSTVDAPDKAVCTGEPPVDRARSDCDPVCMTNQAAQATLSTGAATDGAVDSTDADIALQRERERYQIEYNTCQSEVDLANAHLQRLDAAIADLRLRIANAETAASTACAS